MIKTVDKLKNSFNPLVTDIAFAALCALLFSSFIYLEDLGISIKILNTISALLALTLLIYIPKRAVLFSGFFIGLLWFYWVGYSFEYNGVGFLTPVVIVGFGLIYTLFFGVLAFTNNTLIRALLLFLLSFFEPFDFNWLQIELIFVESYIGIYKYQLALVLLALSLPKYVKAPFTFSPLLLILLALNFSYEIPKEPDLKIKLVSTDVKQELKWLYESKHGIIDENIRAIEEAIKEGYDLVILPESCFPLYMNTHTKLKEKLEDLSHKISIVAGALLREKYENYNVTYFFEDGKTKIAKKMILVPFGEYVPLPKFAQKIISDYFFAGQADFVQANEPTDFIIKGVKFRNAICYEATCQELYEGDVKYLIAISNNAWFAPSIEPTLQKLLIKYYGRKNGTIIYHAANWKGTGVIK